MSQAVTDLNTYCDVKDTRPINGLQMKRIRSKGQHNFCVMGFYSEGSASLSWFAKLHEPFCQKKRKEQFSQRLIIRYTQHICFNRYLQAPHSPALSL